MNPIPTTDQVHEACALARQFLETHHLCLDATIADYPIGRRDRGQCRLQVERAKGRGYRTVKTTTNKRGAWCAPKKSTYRNGPIVVVDDIAGPRTTAWVYLDLSYGIYTSFPAGDPGTNFFRPPSTGKPSREDRTYTVSIQPTWTLDGNGFHQADPEAVTRHEQRVLKADPPELCNAWDIWEEEYRILHSIFSRVWEEASALTQTELIKA
jgi:hypothetical protein